MKTITNTFTVYTFDELPEESKQKAIENYRDINVDYEWWEFTYMDAATIGLQITSFDLDRNLHIEGKLTEYAIDVAKKIIEEHGSMTETYKLAEQYLADYKGLIAEQCQEEANFLCLPEKDLDEYCVDDIDTDDIDQEFERALKEEYVSLLQQEYDYLTSEAQVIETLISNEYEFTIDGRIY